jgi:hypothetical protein
MLFFGLMIVHWRLKRPAPLPRYWILLVAKRKSHFLSETEYWTVVTPEIRNLNPVAAGEPRAKGGSLMTLASLRAGGRAHRNKPKYQVVSARPKKRYKRAPKERNGPKGILNR